MLLTRRRDENDLAVPIFIGAQVEDILFFIYDSPMMTNSTQEIEVASRFLFCLRSVASGWDVKSFSTYRNCLRVKQFATVCHSATRIWRQGLLWLLWRFRDNRAVLSLKKMKKEFVS